MLCEIVQDIGQTERNKTIHECRLPHTHHILNKSKSKSILKLNVDCDKSLVYTIQIFILIY